MTPDGARQSLAAVPPVTGFAVKQAIAALQKRGVATDSLLHRAGLSEHQLATGGDAEMSRFLQQWTGYCLTGDVTEQALVFVHGPGGTGKSVFVKVLTAVIGDYVATPTMEALTTAKGDRHSTEIAILHGSRLAATSETEHGRAWDEPRIKRLAAGDAITARFMRQDNFTFNPTFKLLIVGNHAPRLRNADDAMYRRFNVVPFVHKPERPDLQLEAKLKAEWPAILR
jgi:putative DNA primase/helicase